MGKLDNVSMEELIDKIGFFIRSEDFRIIFRKNTEAIAAAQYIIERYKSSQMFSMSDMEDKIKKLLYTSDSFVDKEAFVLLTLYNIKRELEQKGRNINSKKVREVNQNMSNAMRLLKGANKRVIYFEQTQEKVNRVVVLDSEEVIKAIKGSRKLSTITEPSKEQANRVREIGQAVQDMASFTGVLFFEDIENIVAIDRTIGGYITEQATNNILHLAQRDNPDIDFDVMLRDEPDRMQEIIENSYYEEIALADAIISNCKYVDIDRMLLVIGYRVIEDLEGETTVIKDENGNELYDGTQKEGVDYIRSMLLYFLSQIDKATSIEVAQGERLKADEMDAESTDENIQEDEKEFETIYYTWQDLREDTLRINHGKYYKKQEVLDTKSSLIEGRVLLQDIPIEMRGVFTFESDEYDKIVLADHRNLAFLIREELFNNSEAYRYLEQMSRVPDNVLEALRDEEILDKEKNMQFFEEGKISLSQMQTFAFCDETDENYISTRIRDVYCEMQAIDRNENMEEYNRLLVMFNNYASLYRSIFIVGKDEEEINRKGFHLVEVFGDELSDELLQMLYQNGLVTMQVAGDWGMDLTEMLSKNEIKPTDLKKLYSSGTVSLDQIKTVLIHGDMEIDEKEDLIYSTFDGDTEEEVQIREELMQLLSFGDAYKSMDAEGKGPREIRTGSKAIRREFVTDSQARWNFISLIDEGYSRKFLPEGVKVIDGHRLFLLPNKNEIIIEKMREKKKGRMVGAYGSATYIIGIQEFFDNMSEIIIDGSINRKFLREFVESDQALKIIHSKNWHRNIMRHYGIFKDNDRYEEINKAGERVEKSRKERE